MLNPRIRNDLGAILRELIPLRISIAAIVSVILVSVAGAIVVNDQITGRRAALAEARASFQSHGETVRINCVALLRPVETAVESTAAAMSLLPPDRIITVDTIRLFAQRISETPRMFALYYGDDQGNFMLVFNLAVAAPEAGPAYLAWLIRRPTPADFQQTVITLDHEYRILSTDLNQNNGYDPRIRPWFHPAINSDRVIQTPPYVYFETNDIGITLASRTRDGKGVVGGDLILETLSQALGSNQPTESSLAVVFDDAGGVLAATDVNHVLNVRRQSERPITTQHTLASSGVPGYRVLSRLYASGEGEGVFEVEADGRDWVVWMSPLSLDWDRHVTMGIISPSGEVFAAVNERMMWSLGIAGAGIAIGLLLAWLVANAISKPIRMLTDEAYQMRTFDLRDRPPISSRIVEVDHLSQAVQTLKRSMGDFGRYVPTQLVRRLVSGEMTSEIGGDRAEVSLLFTDIADFTTISESMEPTDLMREVSEYLALASNTLIEHGATIDKYMGDAIMAMWNAPVPQENHVELACRAALETSNVIERLNVRRMAEGKPPFYTRFGLHVGQAVVGNVGSEERMNYTALGETVNLAARLEGLNKQLGTTILISEVFLQALPEEFVVRPVDMVKPQGTTRPVRVFELIGPGQYANTEGNDEAHLESWLVCYTSYSELRWADAVAEFDRHMLDFPNDAVAAVLRARAADYQEFPPPDDWDGVFEAKMK